MQNHAHDPTRRIASLLITALCLGGFLAVSAMAQDAKPEEKKPRWETVANLGVTLTRGNSKNLLATAGLDTVRKLPQDEFFLGAKLSYGDTTVDGEKSTTQQDAKGYGQWNHLFTPRFYGGLRVDGLYDKIAGIHYRFTISPLVGYYFIKNTNMTLSAEVGPSYITEEVVSRVPDPFNPGQTVKRVDENSYIAARVGERFEYKFMSGAKLWQTAEWLPQVTDVENWILIAEIGLSAPVTKKLSAQLVLQDTYDNVPATGRLKNDLKLIAGLAYKF
jgi:putative salt-induced outer membrane protein YdiY